MHRNISSNNPQENVRKKYIWKIFRAHQAVRTLWVAAVVGIGLATSIQSNVFDDLWIPCGESVIVEAYYKGKNMNTFSFSQGRWARRVIVTIALISAGKVSAAEFLAGAFVEPMITYEMGNSGVNYPSPLSNSSGKVEGIGLGGRFGVHIAETFFAGLDLRLAYPQFKDSSTNYDAKSTSSNWGLFVGMQVPVVGLRVWASYILGGEVNPEKSGLLDVKFQNASGYRLGAGYRISIVSLNLEYQQIKYGQAQLEQAGPFTGTSTFDSVSLQNNSWVASVSFPFDL